MNRISAGKVLALPLAVALLTTAFGTGAQANQMLGKKSASSQPQNVDVKDHSFEQKDTLYKALDKEMNRYAKAIEKFENQARSGDEAPALDVQKTLQTLSAKEAEARSAIETLKNTQTRQEWQTARDNVNETISALWGSYKDAQQKIGSGTSAS